MMINTGVMAIVYFSRISLVSFLLTVLFFSLVRRDIRTKTHRDANVCLSLTPTRCVLTRSYPTRWVNTVLYMTQLNVAAFIKCFMIRVQRVIEGGVYLKHC